MADTRREEETRRFLSLAAGRLAHNRWMLAAGWLAVLTVGFSVRRSAGDHGGGDPFPARRGRAGATPYAPGAPGRPRREAEAGRLDGLSAQSLAAAVSDPLVIFDAAGTAVHVNDAARSAFGTIAPGLSLLMKFRAPEMQSAIESVRTGAAASELVDYVERVPIERVYKVTASAIGRGTGLFVVVFKDQSETPPHRPHAGGLHRQCQP